jgi:hypothetical protein
MVVQRGERAADSVILRERWLTGGGSNGADRETRSAPKFVHIRLSFVPDFETITAPKAI